jgi:DNA-binding response OmpR family regulator
MKRRLVLVAEDDADTVEAYGLLFRSRGHDVEVAGDGPAVLFKALELRPDAIVLDLGLPLMDGLEVLRRLRARSAARIPVLVLTGHALPEAAAAALNEGADDVLTKPCEPQELCARLEGLLDAFASRTSAEEPPAKGGPSSGSIRVPRPRYSRRVTGVSAGAGCAASPAILLWETAQAAAARAAGLRRRALQAQLRAQAIRAGVRLRWRATLVSE